MVGRPYPKYKPYEPKEETDEKKKRKDEEPVEIDADLKRQREILEGKRERALEKAEQQGIRKELKALDRPRATIAKDRLSTAGRGIIGFAKELAKEGIRATRPRRARGKGGQRVRRSMAYPGVSHPVSTDISLSKAIAMNEWSGAGRGISDRDFFGSDKQEMDLLGDRNKEINIGSNVQQQFFGDKKDIDLLGGTNKLEIDSLLGGNNKSKKKKEIRYI